MIVMYHLLLSLLYCLLLFHSIEMFQQFVGYVFCLFCLILVYCWVDQCIRFLLNSLVLSICVVHVILFRKKYVAVDVILWLYNLSLIYRHAHFCNPNRVLIQIILSILIYCDIVSINKIICIIFCIILNPKIIHT